jgi:glycine dehydrogenase subunit 1
MLAALGIASVDDLFTSIPAELRSRATIDLPIGISEAELTRKFRDLAGKNKPLTETTSFVGAGSYPYPPIAAALYAISRGEFLTAYTPYQPEISQGTLTALFEFQTWVSELSGMEVANASMYDGASALAEAGLMGLRVCRKAKTIYVSGALHHDVRSVVRRYLAGQHGIDLKELPVKDNGQTDLGPLKNDDADKVLLIGSPNGLGLIEDLAAARAELSAADFLAVHTPDPHVWLLLDPPGAFGADAVAAEGQPLGVPPSFGGPALGLFACKQSHTRQMPGRLCGKTVDAKGRPGFVLTLSTREQHIRREKATSNICTNQGVIALLATVSMSVLGPSGLRTRALEAAQNARRLEKILANFGFRRRHSSPYFNEFVVEHTDAGKLWNKAVKQGIQLGVPLKKWTPKDKSGLLVSATAWQTDKDFSRLEACLQKF